MILLQVEVFLGLLVLIPSVLHALINEIYPVIIIDVIMYACIVFLFLCKKLSTRTKTVGSMLIVYILSVSLVVILGKEGPGLVWMILTPLLASFFYGNKGAAYANLILFFTLVALSFHVVAYPTTISNYENYALSSFILNSISFMVVSIILSFIISETIRTIENSLNTEKELSHNLTDNNLLLAKAIHQLEKEKDRAEESDRLKSSFLANMSHEIRTPLNAILGFSELLNDTNIKIEQRKNYEIIIRSSGEQLLQIVEDILDISKIESNQLKIFIQPADINKALSEVHEIAQNKLKSLQKNIEVELEMTNQVANLLIETDQLRLKQVLQNLVGNALKFTDKGAIIIGYNLVNNKQDIEFYVKDTGHGVPEKDHVRIFERFYQSENKNLNSGNGLGLSISRGLVELLGGKIWVESNIGKGSIFKFTIPNKPAKPQQKKANEGSGGIPEFINKTIYIAEDDELSYKYLEMILLPCRVKINWATNGEDLIKLIDKYMPDLVLLDIKMPGIGGEKTIELIREKDKTLPIIAQTAYALPENRAKYIQLGCNDFISKPIDKNKLYRLLSTYLK